MNVTATTKYAVISLIFLVACVAVTFFILELINREGQKLAEQMKVIGENEQLEAQHAVLLGIMEETKTDRDSLTGFLLTEGKTIHFLSDIESLARQLGLNFTTDSLTVSALPNPQFEELEIKLSAQGDKDTLMKFLSILETLPYYSHLSELSLSRGASDVWSARIGLKVGLNKQDEQD